MGKTAPGGGRGSRSPPSADGFFDCFLTSDENLQLGQETAYPDDVDSEGKTQGAHYIGQSTFTAGVRCFFPHGNSDHSATIPVSHSRCGAE